MKKENQRIALTKRLLKDALLRLLHKKNLDQITITELCQESSINRATFYRHYQTPRDVLVDVEIDLFYELKNTAGLPKSLADYKEYLYKTCQFLYEHAGILKILLDCNTCNDFMNLLCNLYPLILQDQTALKQLPIYDDDSIRLITSYFAGGAYFMMRQWLQDDIRKSPQEISDMLWELFCFAGKIR